MKRLMKCMIANNIIYSKNNNFKNFKNVGHRSIYFFAENQTRQTIKPFDHGSTTFSAMNDKSAAAVATSNEISS